jgi:hypothetical protein
MTMFNQFQFHEATVTGFQRIGSRLILCLEDVAIGGVSSELKLEFSGVREFQVDGISHGDASMAFADGEVLTLDISADSVQFIVEWNDFRQHVSVIRSYHFLYSSVTKVTGGEG